MPPLTTPTVSLELLQDCLGTLEQLTTGITNLGVDAKEDPTQASRVRVLLEELLMSLQQGLIPQGEHLIKRCSQWVARREVGFGWCPEVA
jgi:hypothetical protein